MPLGPIRLHRLASVFVVGICMAVSGCGGGGGGEKPVGVTPTPTARLSGRITVPTDSRVDGDTRDSTSAQTHNDDPEDAQALSGEATVGGNVGKEIDADDIYRGAFTSGQVIDLFVADADADNDLDLLLFDSNGDLVASSVSTTNREQVRVPEAGDYIVRVTAFSGASNYVLQSSLASTAAARDGSSAVRMTHGMRTDVEFVPGEALLTPVGLGVIARGVDPLAALLPMGLRATDWIPQRLARVSLGDPETVAQRLGEGASGPTITRFLNPTVRGRHQTLMAIKALSRRSDVGQAEPDFIRHASVTPDDPRFGDQWHYAAINLPLAWDITTGVNSVLVAVIDTGVLLGHPDLRGQFDPSDPDGFDFISNAGSARDGDGRDPNADDPGDRDEATHSSFHGTHVAGTVAAATDNGAGVAGVAWNARIMPLRALGHGGGSSFDIISAVLYAARLPNASGVLPARRADIANLSLGACNSPSTQERQAYADARSAGLIVFVAAGNDGDDSNCVSFPAAYPENFSVAAVGRFGATLRRAFYSSFNDEVDLAAPGGDQRSGNRDGVLSTHADDSSGAIQATYSFLQGTSMATPHAAGVAALMKSVFPGLTPAQFGQALSSGAIVRDLGPAGRDPEYGFGLLDANLAVREAQRLSGTPPPADTPTLVVRPSTLNFEAGTSRLLLDVDNAGGGSLRIEAIGGTQPWLSISDNPDAAGSGVEFRVDVNRTGLAPGVYEDRIQIRSNANDVGVPVRLVVPSATAAVTLTEVGPVYVLLIDPDTDETVAQFDAHAENGIYAFHFDGVAPGRYLLVAGTDMDEDGRICDSGEACGGFPTQDQARVVEVGSDSLDDLDFLDSFSTVQAAAGASADTGSDSVQLGHARLRTSRASP